MHGIFDVTGTEEGDAEMQKRLSQAFCTTNGTLKMHTLDYPPPSCRPVPFKAQNMLYGRADFTRTLGIYDDRYKACVRDTHTHTHTFHIHLTMWSKVPLWSVPL